MAVREAETVADSGRSDRPARWRGKPLTIVKLAVAAGLMAFVLSRAGLEALAQTLSQTDWRWVLLAMLSGTLAMVINVGRWKLMLRGQGAHAPMGSLVRFYLIGMFFNNVLPSRVGADVVRAYGASLIATTKTRSAAAVLMDRLVGAVSVLAIGLAAILLSASALPEVYLQLIALSSVASLVLLGLMLYRNDRLAGLRLRVLALSETSIFGLKVRPRFEAALNALRGYSRSRDIVVKGFLVSLVANGISMVNLYLYARAVHADVGLGDVATIAPFILAIGLLPISPNGIGTIEAVMVLLFGALGVDEPLALAIALLRRLTLLALSVVGGVLYAVRRFS